MVSAPRLILLMGDQLSRDMSSLRDARKTQDVIVMGELAGEFTCERSGVNHHKKKIVFILSAMRHFAAELREAGFNVDYRMLDAEDPTATFTELIRDAARRHGATAIIVTRPGERRLLNEVESWREIAGFTLDMRDDDRFIASIDEFRGWARGRKSLRMEYFYREMRRKTGLLMHGDEPAGGQWNYDRQNRKPASPGLCAPAPYSAPPDEITQDIMAAVERAFGGHFGDIEPFRFAVSRKGALNALDQFITHALPCFGDYQDAMLREEKFLFHAVLSPYLNVGLIGPLEICRRAERAYEQGHAPLNAVEGFIRQIIGWREYVRGVYWLADDEYARRNFFGNTRALPEFYWTGETDMACIGAVVTQTREEAYAHHIQRLMVTGTFALLAGIDPYAVHEWYLAVYADAYEWVEAPNVIGMSQYADGGKLASKPYAASGAYINRMSDYCKHCAYAVTRKTEADACPFNALYWDFLARNRGKLDSNPRLGQMYKTWERMDAKAKRAYRARARTLLKKLDSGARI